MRFNKVAIIGVGLIGGSLAISLKRHISVKEVWGWGRSEERIARAVTKGLIDQGSTSLKDVVEDADLIVLATPVSTFEEIALSIKDRIPEHSIVTDVGSVKGALVRRLEELLADRAPFVGGHPIAGSDRSGAEHARDDLFEGSTVVITPTERTDPDALNKIELLWKALGAEVMITSPEQHDLMLALISHLPHLISYCLVNTADSFDPQFILHAGGGFRDTTRIALSSEELWADICLYNREAVLKAIDAFQLQLKEVKKALTERDRQTLIDLFSKARQSRGRLQNG